MFSRALYAFFRYLGEFLLRVYYSKRILINQYQLDKNTPYIIAANHPSTLTDPYLIGIEINRKMTFLANYGLFKHPLSAFFFNNFFCIPIQRTMDVGNQKLQNDVAFARCDQHLAENGCIFVAVEGGSWEGRTVRDLRTGAARIAFSAERTQHFQLGVQIVPVVLTYEHARFFRGAVVVHFAPPILVKDFQAAYQADAYAAVNELTDYIANTMHDLSVGTRSDDEDDLAQKAEIMLQSDAPLPFKLHFWRAKSFVKAMQQLPQEQYMDFKKEVAAYFQELSSLSIKDKYINNTFSRNYIKDFFVLLVGFPLSLYGAIHNFFPSFLILALNKQLKLYPGYDATIKMGVGLVTFPLFYWLQTKLFGHFMSDDVCIKWVYFLSMLPAGLLAWQYRLYAKSTFERIKATNTINKNELKISFLQEKRLKIKATIDNMLSI